MLPEIASTTSARLGVRIAVEQRLGRHQHARRAIAALRREILHEGALQRMQVRAVFQSVERSRRERPADGLGERQAGEMKLAVDQHGAGAAAALAAAELRRHVADQLAQRHEQIDAAIDENRDVAAVVAELQGCLGHGDATPGRTAAAADARRRSRGDTRRWRARRSAGDVPSAAAAAAARDGRGVERTPFKRPFGGLARASASAPSSRSAMRAPVMRPPLIGRCAASVITDPPFGLMRATLR